MRECPVQLLIEPIFYLCWRNLRSVAEYSDIPPHHVIPSGVEEPALGRSREAGFSTPQNCPRADNLAALEMTEEVYVSLYCAIVSRSNGPISRGKSPVLRLASKLRYDPPASFTTRSSSKILLRAPPIVLGYCLEARAT